jgi:hypothetical protein
MVTNSETLPGDGDLLIKGKVGIGTRHPGEKLVVGDDIGGTNFTNPEARIAAGNTDGFSGYDLGEDANNRAWMLWDNTNNLLDLGTRSSSTDYDNTIVLKDGKVGIGTNSFTTKFTVFTDTDVDGIKLKGRDGNFLLFGINTTTGGDWNPISDTGDRTIIYGGSTINNPGGGLVLAPWRNDIGSNGLRLDAEGRVTIDLSDVSSPTYLLELKGGAHCDGTGDWMPGSDRAYKKDIDYHFKYGLETVKRLKPVYYVHKQDKTGRKQIGFIAQDVKEIAPELVDGKEGSYGLAYGRITAVLVNAIKEQQKEIETLQKEVKELKNKIKQ